MEGCGLLEAAPDDHAAAVSGPVVAGRAEGLVAAPPALQQGAVERQRHLAHELASRLDPLEEAAILAQEAARHGALDQRPGGHAVGEQRARLEGLVLGLVVHVLAAAGGEQGQHQEAPAAPGRGAAA